MPRKKVVTSEKAYMLR